MNKRSRCRSVALATAVVVAALALATTGCQTSQSEQPADDVVVTEPDAEQHHQPQQPETHAEGHPDAVAVEEGDDAVMADDLGAGDEPTIGDDPTPGDAAGPEAQTDDQVQLPTADQHLESEEHSDHSEAPAGTQPQRQVETADEQLDGRSAPPPSPQPEAGQPQPGAEQPDSAQPDDAQPPGDGPEQAPAGQQPGQPAEHQPEQPEQPAADTADSGDDIDDDDVENFAAAYIGVQDLNYEYDQRLNATTDPEETNALQQQLQQQTTEVIEANDLSVEQFHAIAQLVETDSELRDRIQTEIDEIAH